MDSRGGPRDLQGIPKDIPRDPYCAYCVSTQGFLRISNIITKEFLEIPISSGDKN